MRIVQIINSFALNRGGAERLARTLHSRLRASGTASTIIALEACPTDDLEGSISLGYASPYDPRIPCSLGKCIRSLGHPIDVFHVHLFPASGHTAMLSALGFVNAPCVFTEHNTSNGRRGKVMGRIIDRAIYGRFDLIGAISDGVRDALGDEHPSLLDRCSVVPNGVDLRFSAPIKRPARDEITILSAGRLVEQKNYAVALRAIAKLRELPIRYVVLGDGPDRRDMVALAQDLGISDRLELRGHVPDIGPYLETADIFLMPSKWEGFGMAAVEAMNAALPLVVSDVPGLREVTGPDGVCARLVAADDPQGFAQAIEDLVSSPTDRSALGTAGFERAKRFETDQMVRAYLACYETLLAKQQTYA